MSAEGPTPGGEPLNVTASMEVFMTGLESSLGKSLGPLKEISEKIGSGKFKDNVKKFGGAMKGMAGASVNAWAMEQLMKLIEPFMKLLQLLEIPINVLSALLTVMVNEIFVQLLPFFLQLADILIALMPIFKILGQIIGVVLVWAINQIIERLKFVWNLFKEIAIYLGNKFGPAWEKIKAVFVAIGGFLSRVFGPLWEGIKTLFTGVKKAWDESGGKIFGKDGFIAKAFGSLVTFGKSIGNWFIGVINSVIGFINKIPGVNIGKIPLLQEGGIITATTPAILHPNEAVVPLDRASEFGFGSDPRILSELEEGNRLQRIIIKQNREAAAWQL